MSISVHECQKVFKSTYSYVYVSLHKFVLVTSSVYNSPYNSYHTCSLGQVWDSTIIEAACHGEGWSMGDQIWNDCQPLVNIASWWPKLIKLKTLREIAVHSWAAGKQLSCGSTGPHFICKQVLFKQTVKWWFLVVSGKMSDTISGIKWKQTQKQLKNLYPDCFWY